VVDDDGAVGARERARGFWWEARGGAPGADASWRYVFMCACACGDGWWMVAVSSSAGRRDGATMGARDGTNPKTLIAREVFAAERLRGGCRRRSMERGVRDACVRIWCVY